MLRRITLSLLIIVSVLVMIPFASSTAHGIRQTVVTSRRHLYRRHSRAWWRRYRARLKRRREAALAHRNAPLVSGLTSTVKRNSSATLPKLPSGWSTVNGNNAAEMRFRTEPNSGVPAGQASLAVVALSRPTPTYLSEREQKRLLSGVSVADLRRIVIDRMMNSGGWVTNDYERMVTGHRVFIVTAQTPADGRSPDKVWNFYFTEVNGKIYSLTTNTPLEFSNRMDVEAEGFIASLFQNGNPGSPTQK